MVRRGIVLRDLMSPMDEVNRIHGFLNIVRCSVPDKPIYSGISEQYDEIFGKRLHSSSSMDLTRNHVWMQATRRVRSCTVEVWRFPQFFLRSYCFAGCDSNVVVERNMEKCVVPTCIIAYLLCVVLVLGQESPRTDWKESNNSVPVAN